MSIKPTKTDCGYYFDSERPGYEASPQAFADDHGMVIEIDEHTWIRVNPQDFPGLIKLMANELIGMVEF